MCVWVIVTYNGLYRGYIGRMEKKMDTNIWGLGFRQTILFEAGNGFIA